MYANLAAFAVVVLVIAVWTTDRAVLERTGPRRAAMTGCRYRISPGRYRTQSRE